MTETPRNKSLADMIQNPGQGVVAPGVYDALTAPVKQGFHACMSQALPWPILDLADPTSGSCR
jgi:hypothetical protein